MQTRVGPLWLRRVCCIFTGVYAFSNIFCYSAVKLACTPEIIEYANWRKFLGRKLLTVFDIIYCSLYILIKSTLRILFRANSICEKQPVVWKYYCDEFWYGKARKHMGIGQLAAMKWLKNVLKTALNATQSYGRD